MAFELERSDGSRGYGRLAAAVIVVAVQDYTEARLTFDGGLGSARSVSDGPCRFKSGSRHHTISGTYLTPY